MKVKDFLIEFQDVIQSDDELFTDTMLIDLEEWDSMAIMACMAWFDVKLGIKVVFNDFLPIDTVQDVINLSQGKIAN